MALEFDHRPRDRGELREWIKQHLGLAVADQAVCPGHAAPLDYLAHAFAEPAADAVVWAPRGGGKTTLGAAATLLDMLFKPRCQVRILGGSLEQSQRMRESLDQLLEPPALAEQVARQTERRLVLANGSAAAILAQSQRSVRGVHVHKLRCDEVELFDPDIWEAAQLVPHSRPVADGTTAAGVIEAFSTLHAPGGLMARVLDAAALAGRRVFHWCLLEVLEQCPAWRECATCPLDADCRGEAKKRPGGHLRIDDAIAMKRRVSVETWEAEVLCRRPAVHNRVFPGFDPAVHVSDDAETAGGKLWLALDFGFQNPFVCLWARIDGEGNVAILDEHVASRVQMSGHVEAIKARNWGPIHAVACDPAGNHANDQTGRTNVELLRRQGWSVRTAGSRIADGVELIRAALRPAAGPPTLRIHSRCRRLITALESYRYAGETDERPLKDNIHDHPIDALRYLLINCRRHDAKCTQP